MVRIRPPAVAGLFYPAVADELARLVDGYLEAAAAGLAGETEPPKAVIAPHAGYVYSGPIAASAFSTLGAHAATIARVVVIGPSHFVSFTGLALPAADAFATPLGEVAIDADAVAEIIQLSQVHELPAVHAREHGLEVELPFLQRLLGHFVLVPIVVGEAARSDVAEVLDRLWGGDETLVVVSSDLSHYHDYRTAQRLDRETSHLIEARSAIDLRPEQACGCRAINGLLSLAVEHGLAATTLDLRSSGDTAGGKDQVVGYGAYGFN